MLAIRTVWTSPFQVCESFTGKLQQPTADMQYVGITIDTFIYMHHAHPDSEMYAHQDNKVFVICSDCILLVCMLQ